MLWWVWLLVRVACIVDDKSRESPGKYRPDLPVIAVAEVFQQYCMAGNTYSKYKDILRLKKEDRHFLFREVMEALKQVFELWATRICAPYENVRGGNLSVYLSERKSPDLLSPFHLVYQSIRLHHVFSLSFGVDLCLRISPQLHSRNCLGYHKDLFRMWAMCLDFCRKKWELQT